VPVGILSLKPSNVMTVAAPHWDAATVMLASDFARLVRWPDAYFGAVPGVNVAPLGPSITVRLPSGAESLTTTSVALAIASQTPPGFVGVSVMKTVTVASDSLATAEYVEQSPPQKWSVSV